MSIERHLYSTSLNRRIWTGQAETGFALATQVEGVFGDLFCRTEETASTTTNISTGAAAANVIDSLEEFAIQMGSATDDITDIFTFADEGTSIKVLEYTGNGVDPQAVTGVGFQPDAAIIYEPGTAKVFVKTKDHAGDNCRDMSGDTGPNNADAIDSFDADGFTVASAVNLNTNLTNYVALCLQDTVGYIKAVSYTGDGAGARSITGVGFQPDLMIVMRSDVVAQVLGLKTRTMLNGEALDFSTGAKVDTNSIDTLDTDGWTFIGTGNWNIAAAEYSAICMRVGFA